MTSAQPNQYLFKDQDESLKINYYPTAPGPLIENSGSSARGARLDYQGSEGSFAFSGAQVRIQDSPLGIMATVTLQPNFDTGELTLTLIVPPVDGATQEQPQDFSTIGIKTRRKGFVVQPGAQLTYERIDLRGTANVVMLPL